MTTIGLVTIGQAPRVDLTPDILPRLAGLRVVEHGALDHLDAATIASLAPSGDEPRVVSRLRDGGSATMSERAVEPWVQDAVDRAVADGADAVLILCTGYVAGVLAPVPVHTAEKLARTAAVRLIGDDELVVFVPTPEQVHTVRERWADDYGITVTAFAVDPYSATLEQMAALAATSVPASAGWIFLDCIGYTEEMATVITAAGPGARALTARGLAADAVGAEVRAARA